MCVAAICLALPEFFSNLVFVAVHRPLTPIFACRCPAALVPAVHCLLCFRQWLVVVFSARPAAYQPNNQAENVFMFPHLDLFFYV
jgi:hypothetical protein